MDHQTSLANPKSVLTNTDLKSLWQHGTLLRGDPASFASTFHHLVSSFFGVF